MKGVCDGDAPIDSRLSLNIYKGLVELHIYILAWEAMPLYARRYTFVFGFMTLVDEGDSLGTMIYINAH